jgi:hypothetical protein
VAYSFSINVSIDVTVIVQLSVSIPGVVEGFTAGSYGGKQAVMSSSEMLACCSNYNLLWGAVMYLSDSCDSDGIINGVATK